MHFETVPMFDDLPVTDPKEVGENQLSKNFRQRLDELGLELVDVHKGTSIAWSTLMDWYRGKRKAQVADRKIYELARFLRTSVEWLLFGEGEKERTYQ